MTARRAGFAATIGAVLLGAGCGSHTVEIDAQEAWRHQLFADLIIHRRLDRERDVPGSTTLSLTVDETGFVTAACLSPYPGAPCHRLDPTLLRGARYRPFLRNGRPVRAHLYADATLLPLERPAKEVPFPQLDLATLKIELTRGTCFGSCPAYNLKIDGQGNVTWHGYSFTLLDGERQARIPVAEVRQLVRRFQGAKFFGLQSAYHASITDGSETEISLSMSGRSKHVSDYYGIEVGMPRDVRALEAEIDRVTGVDRWVDGTPETVAILAGEGVNFASSRGGDMIPPASDRPAFLEALLARIDRPDQVMTSRGDRALPIALIGAVRASELRSVELLERTGVTASLSPNEIDDALKAAALNVDPLLIARVMRWPSYKRASPDGKAAALSSVVNTYFGMVGRASRDRFDKRAAIAMLIAGGADPNRPVANGETLLALVAEPDVARQLVAAGADPDRQDRHGVIPLLANSNEETSLYLVGVTHPGVADRGIAQKLRQRAVERQWVQLSEAILAGRPNGQR